MKAAAKKMKISDADARAKANTVEGLRELKNDLSPGLYNKIAKERYKEIIYQGRVKAKLSGNEYAEIINKGENFELISELSGKEAAEDLLIATEKIGKSYVSRQRLKKLIQTAKTIKTLALIGAL